MEQRKNNSTKINQTQDFTKGSKNLGRLFLQLRRLERSPQVFGAAGPLTPSEIHTIDAIGCGKGILMSELAASLNVTKGAVTQIVKRLEKKELVKRSPHPKDSRSVLVSLKEKGISACEAHQELQLDFYKQLRTKLTPEEIEVFEKAIEKLTEYMISRE